MYTYYLRRKEENQEEKNSTRLEMNEQSCEQSFYSVIEKNWVSIFQ